MDLIWKVNYQYGPISTVGQASIEAAISPNTTDYLFFVADKNGNVYFTKTNEEHQAKIDEIKANNDWIF
ncbi:MAG: endolytic transglycosylase MltG [Clostridia bacterium]|nr:endolytic transglycosylase MltG [Clostridia bacterium]